MSLPPVWAPIIEWGVSPCSRARSGSSDASRAPCASSSWGRSSTSWGRSSSPTSPSSSCATSTCGRARRRGSSSPTARARSSRSSPAACITDRFGRRRTLLVSLFGSGAPRGGDGARPLGRSLRAAARRFRLHRRPLPARRLGDDRRPPAVLRARERLRRPAHGGEPRLGGGHRASAALLADWDWRLLFLGDGLTTLAYGVLVYFTIPETRPEGLVGRCPPRAPPTTPDRAAARRPVLRPRGPTNRCATASSCRTFTGAPLHVHLLLAPLGPPAHGDAVGAGYPAVVFGLLAAVNGVLGRLLRDLDHGAAQAVPASPARRPRLLPRARSASG